MWSRCRKSAVEVMPDKLQKFCVISLTQGGKHADNTIDIQEFMVIPLGCPTFADGLERCVRVTHRLGALLEEAGLPSIRFHDLRHPYVKHTTKNIFPQKQKSQTTNAY